MPKVNQQCAGQRMSSNVWNFWRLIIWVSGVSEYRTTGDSCTEVDRCHRRLPLISGPHLFPVIEWPAPFRPHLFAHTFSPTPFRPHLFAHTFSPTPFLRPHLFFAPVIGRPSPTSRRSKRCAGPGSQRDDGFAGVVLEVFVGLDGKGIVQSGQRDLRTDLTQAVRGDSAHFARCVAQ